MITPKDVRAKRLELGLTQDEFGEWLGEQMGDKWYKRKMQTVHLWEAGKQAIPAWLQIAFDKKEDKPAL